MTPAGCTFSFVLPVYNQERVLGSSVRRLHERLHQHPGSEILLIENGSEDSSRVLCWQLAQELDGETVAVSFATSDTGLGRALRRGMELATRDVVVLTAADLPFGFSDLDGYLALAPRPQLAIGSKAHPASRTDTAVQRRVMSEVFRWLRRGVLGLRVRDSQGTILISSALSRRVQPHLECDDFLISTEVICWAIREGALPVELPVVYPRSTTSTVSPLRDSARMFAGMVALRSRLQTRGVPAPVLQRR